MTPKIKRNLSTPESRKFWWSVDRTAKEVCRWPSWKRAGINVVQMLDAPRKPYKKGD